MNICIFDKITILIPTFDRCIYLSRILNYYRLFKIPFRIVVADSSSEENKCINHEIISALSGLNILHLTHYPFCYQPYNKLADASNYVVTEYSVICADDDFVTPSGINQAVEFLEENPDFAVADGYYIRFWLELNSVGIPVFFWKSVYPHKSIIFPDAKSRLSYHFPNYQPSFYAVHRADFMKKAFQEMLNSNVGFHFSELLLSMLDMIPGKTAKLDVFYCARDHIPAAFYPARAGLRDLIKDGSYEQRYADFSNCLAMHLSAKGQIGVREAKKVVDETMFLYFTSHVMSDKMKDEKTRLLHKQQSLKQKEINANFEHSTRAGSSKYNADLERICRVALASAITIYKPGLKEIASTLVG